MPFHIGPTELVIVLAIVLIVFGVGKLPQAGSAVGRAVREFRAAQRQDGDEGMPSLPRKLDEGEVRD